MFQPNGLREKERAFSDFHVTDLPRRQAEFLVLLAFGLSDEDISGVMGVATETVRQHSHEARLRVTPPEYDATRANGQFWASRHLADCLAPAYLARYGREGTTG